LYKVAACTNLTRMSGFWGIHSRFADIIASGGKKSEDRKWGEVYMRDRWGAQTRTGRETQILSSFYAQAIGLTRGDWKVDRIKNKKPAGGGKGGGRGGPNSVTHICKGKGGSEMATSSKDQSP